MRTTTSLIAVVTLALAGCGKDASPPLPPPTGSAVPQDDYTRIRGFWAATSVRNQEGKPDEVPGSYTVLFDNGNYKMDVVDSTESGKYTLFASVNPKQIDLVTNDGDLRRGLYTLDGDKLTLCFAVEKGAPRPTEFRVNADDNRVTIVTFTRTK